MVVEGSNGAGKFLAKTLVEIYGNGVILDLHNLSPTNKTSIVMRNILDLRHWPGLEQLISPEQFTRQIQNGTFTFFWLDKWHQAGTLKDTFPDLFEISLLQNSKVSEVVGIFELEGGSYEGWWCRTLNSQEKQSSKEIWSIVRNISLSERKDIVVWKPSRNTYTTKRCYDKMLTSHNDSNLWSKIWSIKAS